MILTLFPHPGRNFCIRAALSIYWPQFPLPGRGFCLRDAVSASATRFPLPARHCNIGLSDLVGVYQKKRKEIKKMESQGSQRLQCVFFVYNSVQKGMGSISWFWCKIYISLYSAKVSLYCLEGLSAAFPRGIKCLLPREQAGLLDSFVTRYYVLLSQTETYCKIEKIKSDDKNQKTRSWRVL